MADNNRMRRIDEEIKREVSQIISFELHDPHATGLISVTKVKTTPDLRYSRIFISLLNSKNKKETLATLKKSSGFIRSELARRINLRTTPELVFEFDESIEYGAKIDQILRDINNKGENK